MAVSPAHRFGQIIGELLERAIEPLLAGFAREHGLYLDRHGKRPCRNGLKCTWVDHNGNAHDLDYVLERGGTPEKHGLPVAFIETAWRRYTKHSRNKAQEIQGALVPLVETHRQTGPFVGAVLAGVFTQGALTQLRSLGFTVLYFPYDSVVKVFRKFDIDAAFDEDTPHSEFQDKVDAYVKMGGKKRDCLAKELVKAHKAEVDAFLRSLTGSVVRRIKSIVLLPLHGSAHEVKSIAEAVAFIEEYTESKGRLKIHRYEIQVRYSNGDRIEARFQDKETVLRYLRGFLPGK